MWTCWCYQVYFVLRGRSHEDTHMMSLRSLNKTFKRMFILEIGEIVLHFITLRQKAIRKISIALLLYERLPVEQGKNYWMTPFHCAYQNGHLDIVRMLLKYIWGWFWCVNGLLACYYIADSGHQDIVYRIPYLNET